MSASNDKNQAACDIIQHVLRNMLKVSPEVEKVARTLSVLENTPITTTKTEDQIAAEHGFKVLQSIHEEEEKDMLRELKGWDRDRSDMDTEIALLAFSYLIAEQYKAVSLDVPEWLNDRIYAISRKIDEKRRDYKVRELKMLKAKLETIKSKDVTAKDLEAKIAALAKELV